MKLTVIAPEYPVNYNDSFRHIDKYAAWPKATADRRHVKTETITN